MLCQCNQLQAFSVRQLEKRTWQLQRLLGGGRQNTACIRRHRHGWAGTTPEQSFQRVHVTPHSPSAPTWAGQEGWGTSGVGNGSGVRNFSVRLGSTPSSHFSSAAHPSSGRAAMIREHRSRSALIHRQGRILEGGPAHRFYTAGPAS